MKAAISFILFMGRLALLAIALFMACLTANAQEIARDSSGKIARNPSLIRQFKATQPCPATGKVQKSCPGYVVDHILPLCAYGLDRFPNLQWQSVADSKAKDVLENLQCRAIKQATCQVKAK
jgi:hypothetical protein